MFDIKKSRTMKAESKHQERSNRQTPSFLSMKKDIQKLSLSFYGQDTIKKNKQIILDDCDIFDSLPEICSIVKHKISKEKQRFKQSLKNSTANNKQTNLKIDALFMDEKIDDFQFITTNASQFQSKLKEKHSQGKKKISRSNSVKAKGGNEKCKRETLPLDVLSVRCKTSKCVSRKTKLKDKPIKNK